jgi:hypothetical protein
MADYNQLKNAAILTPTTGTDLGSTTNPYSNVYLSGNIAMSNGVVINPTTVTSPKISSITYPGVITAVLPAGGETVTITGTGFSNAGGTPQVFVGTTVVPTVTYISSTSLTFTTPARSVGVYSIYVVNSDGGVGIYAPGISFSGTPSWTTAAGSIGSTQQGSSSSFTVLATSDSVVTYSVKAGSSLPSGLSLNSSTGAITGTAPTPASQTTYTFTLTATDTENQTTDRSFNITVLTVLSIDYIVVAGGGSGGGTYYGGGGGAGGLLTASSITLTPSTTYTVVVGAGASPGAANGSNSSLIGTGLSVTTIGGGRGGATYGGDVGTSGGSGGGSAAAGAYNNGAGTAGPPRQGYNGGTVSSGNAIYGGGGGGSGGAGQPGTNGSSPSGTGGLGTNLASIVGVSLATSSSIGYISGSEVQFAGGGGGAQDANAGTLAWRPPGSAGGGIGAMYVNGQNAGAGQANTGSGGGGGCHPGTNNGTGGAGGSGVVIIRYSGSTAQATGGTIIDTSGGYVTHIFKTTGTFSFVTGV